MSGYKHATVTISQQEYRRLHQAEIKRRFKEYSKNAKASFQAANLNQAFKEMESRQQQLEHTLNNVGQNYEWMGAEMMQDILTENERCHENLVTILEETTSASNTSLDILSQRFTEEMQREREQYYHHLQLLGRRLNTYEQKEHSKVEAARRWLRQSVTLADLVQEQFDHERFLPGKVSRLCNNLNVAQDNLAQRFFESSLQISQQVFLQLSELRFELEQRILEWQVEYTRVHNAIKQFIIELEMNSKVDAVGLEGEELTEQVDLAYWSNGKYNELLEKCRQLLILLSQESRSISTDELRQTYNGLLPVIRDKFESIIHDAQLKALNSQLRMNIAEKALQALETQGFKLNNAGYIQEDMRSAFTAQLENLDGSQVIIKVLPAEQQTQELTNELVMVTNHPFIKTEQEARLQWQELCRALNEYDLQVSRAEVLSTAPPAPLLPAESAAVGSERPLKLKSFNHV